jgi:colanic acid/amylovoran biosynthesis glycosyltransferase
MVRRVRYWTRRVGLSREQIYQHLVDLMGWWTLAWFRPDRPHRSGRPLSIAYVFGRHPILSETFIRREIAALKHAGIPVQTVADEPDAPSVVADPALGQSDTIYLLPMDPLRRARFIKECIRRAPLRSLNVFLYVVFSRYGSYKTWEEDLNVTRHAMYLAGVLDERGVTHVHAPWANYHAFLAMLAARLMGVTYSVHARANEFHRISSNYLLAAKLRNATFAVTNSRYNEAQLRPSLGARRAERLHVIYNGLNLGQFSMQNARSGGPVRILAIGRLVTMKGFDYLLRACAILRERGVDFVCDIIGRAHEALDANAPLELKKLHRRLDLGSIVRFHGAQPFDAVMRAYAEADIVALPCVIASDGSRDITPNVLLEAMAMRLAVVSTPVGAIPEIIDDGINGLIVPCNDERRLGDALEMLARDEALRRKLGEAARTKIEVRFDIERNVQEYARLFRML